MIRKKGFPMIALAVDSINMTDQGMWEAHRGEDCILSWSSHSPFVLVRRELMEVTSHANVIAQEKSDLEAVEKLVGKSEYVAESVLSGALRSLAGDGEKGHGQYL
jgi:hypothetical protein